MHASSLSERVRGVLLGLVAGDRNGGPTQMAHELATSLLTCTTFRPEDDILQRYRTWWHNGGFDSGPITAQVLTLLDHGVAPEIAPVLVHRAVEEKTAGCNPAHRASPLAMAAFLPDANLSACAIVEARLTHWHPLAGETAAIVVQLCRALIRGQAWAEALSILENTSEQLKPLLQSVTIQPENRSGFVPSVLHAALYFLHHAPTFQNALDESIAFAGPANYCPVLVGAIDGARWGIHAIPPTSLNHCVILPAIMEQADRFAKGWDRAL